MEQKKMFTKKNWYALMRTNKAIWGWFRWPLLYIGLPVLSVALWGGVAKAAFPEWEFWSVFTGRASVMVIGLLTTWILVILVVVKYWKKIHAWPWKRWPRTCFWIRRIWDWSRLLVTVVGLLLGLGLWLGAFWGVIITLVVLGSFTLLGHINL